MLATLATSPQKKVQEVQEEEQEVQEEKEVQAVGEEQEDQSLMEGSDLEISVLQTSRLLHVVFKGLSGPSCGPGEARRSDVSVFTHGFLKLRVRTGQNRPAAVWRRATLNPVRSQYAALMP
ncbi:unnamed protein product [Merluccius merluccius]